MPDQIIEAAMRALISRSRLSMQEARAHAKLPYSGKVLASTFAACGHFSRKCPFCVDVEEILASPQAG